MKKRILFVDDEAAILRALQRLFFDSEYEIHTAASGEDGLRILDKVPIDVVVSDMRMPEMDGNAFLKKVRTLHPSTTRLILSGYAEEKVVLDSLISGAGSAYLFKPWDERDLVRKLAQIFETRKLFKNEVLLDLVNRLENLSLVTGVYDTVSRLIEEEASVVTIARAIENDPAVTAAILRIVNSAFYNVKTGSVAQAMTFLGLTTIKSIILSCSLFKLTHIAVPPFSANRLANHAAATNLLLTRIYSGPLRKQLPEIASTAGLLHNLGLVLCLYYFPDKYTQIAADFTGRPEQDIAALEERYLGISHADLGGYLLNWWGLPYPIVEAALFHHRPLHQAVVNREIVAVVHVANHYAWKHIAPHIAPGLDDGVFQELGITPQDCEQLL